MAKKKIQVKDSVDIDSRQIRSFLNTEVRDYAKYVIETRAMPNIMDGLRVGARKILWAAMIGDLRKKENVKMPSLIGDALKLHYNHGDASLQNTIVQLASKHVYEMAPLEVDGQIGTLRIPKCDTAPRYLGIMKTKYLDIFKTDKELLKIQVEEGDEVEPTFFLPILPIALLWRTNSPGFGFSYKAFSYDVNTVIDNCIKAVNTGSCQVDTIGIQMVPKVRGINQKNILYNGNKDAWFNIGEYKLDFEKNTCIVSDLPYSVTFDKYEEHLNDLVEKNLIAGFTDLGMDGNIKYLIKFAHGRLQMMYNDKWKFYKMLKLYTKIPKDILNVIDEDGKRILFFESPEELIDTFVKKRLVYYQKRKTKTIKVIKELIEKLSNQIKFIQLVTDDVIIINKRKSVEIKADLDKHQLPYEVLKLNIDKLTQDEIDKMNAEIKEQQDYLAYIERTTIKEMYINDLVDFKEKYVGIKTIEI